MQITFKLKDSLKRMSASAKSGIGTIRAILDKNCEAACKAALREVKKRTPHKGDGKKRGENMITNALQKAWRVDWNLVNKTDKAKIYAEIVFTNEKTYAPYVQYGHKMSQHFVPWLYKDGRGTLSRDITHDGKPFGLVVGNRTPFVKGVDMVNPAMEAFNKAFDKLNNDKLVSQLDRILARMR